MQRVAGLLSVGSLKFKGKSLKRGNSDGVSELSRCLLRVVAMSAEAVVTLSELEV